MPAKDLVMNKYSWLVAFAPLVVLACGSNKNNPTQSADAGLPLDCDPQVAQQAILSARVTPAGAASASDIALPIALATGDWTYTPDSGLWDPWADWGQKQQACQQAGYDLAPLGGDAVCLLFEPISETCYGGPATVYVVMHGGTVGCVYLAVSGVPGGVYSAPDMSCH